MIKPFIVVDLLVSQLVAVTIRLVALIVARPVSPVYTQ